MYYFSYSKHLELLNSTHYREGERDLAINNFVKQNVGQLDAAKPTKELQGTVLGQLLVIILKSDIGVLNDKVVSFADNTRLILGRPVKLRAHTSK